jgi:hypothetical protein
MGHYCAWKQRGLHYFPSGFLPDLLGGKARLFVGDSVWVGHYLHALSVRTLCILTGLPYPSEW